MHTHKAKKPFHINPFQGIPLLIVPSFFTPVPISNAASKDAAFQLVHVFPARKPQMRHKGPGLSTFGNCEIESKSEHSHRHWRSG
mmetsp:Transcript_57584/g.160376  ORF Transcript_57584/g.160376 Transcript_57584/m.160376 type:complete len:85 (-) Transcript_57584:667-921(-)